MIDPAETKTPPPPLPPSAPPKQPGSGKGCWIAIALFALVMLLVVGAVILLLISFTRSVTGTQASAADGSILELSFSAPMAEGPPEVELGALFGGSQPSFWGLRRALEAAIEDDDIAGIRLDLGFSVVGWPTAEEILSLLDRFRETGRPVYASVATDQLDDLDYFLATAADQIYLSPAAASMINGLVSQPLFHRGTLERLKIEPQVIMYKEYKSAGEAYANYEMSPYMREALEAVLLDVDARFVERVTSRRGVTAEALRELLNRGMSSAQSLVDIGLVDRIGYSDELEQAIIEAAGVDEYSGMSLNSYLTSLGRERSRGDGRIAVVFGEGTIIAPEIRNPFPLFGAIFSGPVVAEHLRRAAEDPSVSAIVFRVNSPGGSPVGSDIVRREIERAQSMGKPVVVSMSDVAGSGGYWVAMGADRILAHPTTVTGSIGVVFSKFNLEPFLEHYGTTTATVKTAENADLFASGSWDAEERAAVMDWMDQVYADFTGKVAEGRGLPLERVREIARGRIWSGTDAVDIGLVDELGGLDRALEIARELSGSSGATPIVYPRPKTLYQQMMEGGFVTARSRLGLDLEALQRSAQAWAAPKVQALMTEPVIE